ncbi:MAG TPA: creatininase family protein [Polyangia bacterium]|jgi:creatinine amidohydrolase
MQLLERSSTAARATLASGAPVFVPVNPIEYHGPHLPLRTDGLVAAGLIRDLHAALAARRQGWPLLVVPDLEAGCDPVPGPGSRPVSYPRLRELVEGTCAALASLGARRVVLMTFHGSPLHNLALEAGVQLLRRRGVRAVAPFHLVLRRLIDGAGQSVAAEALAEVTDPEERASIARDLGRDIHAGFLETSLALHYAPASVHPRYVDLPPCPAVTPAAPLAAAARAARALGRRELAGELDFAAHGLGWYALRPFPAYTGRPHRATARAGAALAARIVAEGMPMVLEVLDGRAAPPPPVMTWAASLSLGGRVGLPQVPLSDVASGVLE